MWYNNFVVNQKSTPGIIADVLGNRPAFANIGTLFIATDTQAIYRFNGSSWVQIIGTPGVSTSVVYITATASNSVSDVALIGRTVLLVSLGGAVSGEIITIGTPTQNELLFDSVTGTLSKPTGEEFASGELVTVIYS